MNARAPVLVGAAVGALGLVTAVLAGSPAAVATDEQRRTAATDEQRRTAATDEQRRTAATDEQRRTAAAWAHDFLHGAAHVAASTPHQAELVVVGFGERGPRIARLDVTFDGAEIRFVREPGLEPGPEHPPGLLRASARLLHVGGPAEPAGRFDRLLAKYEPRRGDPVELDTGQARTLALHERSGGGLREVLYADVDSGLLVRRETYDPDGAPLRTAAYTRVTMDGAAQTLRAGAPDDDVSARPGPATDDLDRLRASGFTVPRTLPHGYDLVEVEPVAGARIPTVHLVYADGLYTLSVFEQLGRMRPGVVSGARERRLAGGGAVWRWPGSEPQRMVWSGGGATFTAFGDAPPDELLEVVAGLPADPPPSILDRLGRGFSRLLRWTPTDDRSET